MSKMSARRLVGTGKAAQEIGVDRTTLGRWAAAGLATPAQRTAGGHLRWDVEQLKQQIDELHANDSK